MLECFGSECIIVGGVFHAFVKRCVSPGVQWLVTFGGQMWREVYFAQVFGNVL